MTKSQRQPVLVTGGAGYIGSHTVLELLLAGYPVVVLDNLSNASPEALVRVERITGARAPLVVGDIRDEALVTDLLARHDFGAVLHFAGLKAVGESVAKPLAYYDSYYYQVYTLGNWGVLGDVIFTNWKVDDLS